MAMPQAQPELDAKAAKKTKGLSIAFKNVFDKTSRSKASLYPPPQTAHLGSETVADDYPTDENKLVRSRSEDLGPRVKEEWAEQIWDQENLKQSVISLQSSVSDYEKEATRQQWADLFKISSDVTELGKLAEVSNTKNVKMAGDGESLDGLTKFTTVALEYSKMLDVVMNQSPEYAALVWGAIRMLLVAHTNHSKLKQAVQQHLIQFGQGFGVVNQLMSCHPTAKMVEFVTEAYAAFSKFLAKAIAFYKESKLTSAIKAFGFPWESRFQLLVARIEAAFRHIREISQAGHFGLTVQVQHAVKSIGAGQEQLRLSMRQDAVDLRQQLKLELKNEVQALFDSFDRNWISRFEQIMIQSAQDRAALHDTHQPESSAAPGASVAIQYAESMTEESPRPVATATFLADHVMKAKSLKRFRDKAFPHLQETDNDDLKVNARLKHLTIHDLQSIVSLFRNESVRGWLQANFSSLIWINTFRRSGLVDWGTAFAVKLIQDAGKVQDMAVLHYFCGNHPSSWPVSTPRVVIESIIIQLLQQYHKKFIRRAFPFTLEHFQDVLEDIEELWDLFHSCCAEAEVVCIWLIIDNIDNLQRGDDYDFLIQGLQRLTEETSRVFKIFITARTSGTPSSISDAAHDDPNSRRIASVTVPKAQSSTAAAAPLSKQKRLTRLPDSYPEASTAPKPDIQGLLESSEEDLPSERETDNPAFPEPPASTSPRSKSNKASSRNVSDLDVSDSSLEFVKDDPFASSAESLSDGCHGNGFHSADSEEDHFSFATGTPKKNPTLLSSSDESDLPEITPAKHKNRLGSAPLSK